MEKQGAGIVTQIIIAPWSPDASVFEDLASCTDGEQRSGWMFETESRYPQRRRKLPALASD